MLPRSRRNFEKIRGKRKNLLDTLAAVWVKLRLDEEKRARIWEVRVAPTASLIMINLVQRRKTIL
jgi:hypothetical protein